jgi:Rieske Fe-S protein
MAGMDRKKFLKLAVHGIGTIVAGIVAVPALTTALSPLWNRRHGPLWEPLGRLEEFPVTATVHKAVIAVPREDSSRSLREKGVYVWRPSAEEIVVFSRNCTDLGCPVTWDPGSAWFFCPCHGGIFAQNGARKAGPPKRPLFRYANRVRNGVIEIDVKSLPAMT